MGTSFFLILFLIILTCSWSLNHMLWNWKGQVSLGCFGFATNKMGEWSRPPAKRVIRMASENLSLYLILPIALFNISFTWAKPLCLFDHVEKVPTEPKSSFAIYHWNLYKTWLLSHWILCPLHFFFSFKTLLKPPITIHKPMRFSPIAPRWF